MSILKFVNLFIFQWFFIRLTKCTVDKIENFKICSYDMMRNGDISSRGIGSTKKYQWYSIQYWIVPCTGWKNDFKYLNKEAKFIKITKEKSI